MKHYLLSILITFAGMSAWGQNTPVDPTEPGQEMHAMSGQLKDLHGQVHQRLGALDRHLANATDNSRIKMTQLREELDQTRTELENSLNEVNSNDLENWPEIKQRAEDVKARAEATLEKARTTSMSAVN